MGKLDATIDDVVLKTAALIDKSRKLIVGNKSDVAELRDMESRTKAAITRSLMRVAEAKDCLSPSPPARTESPPVPTTQTNWRLPSDPVSGVPPT